MLQVQKKITFKDSITQKPLLKSLHSSCKSAFLFCLCSSRPDFDYHQKAQMQLIYRTMLWHGTFILQCGSMELYFSCTNTSMERGQRKKKLLLEKLSYSFGDKGRGIFRAVGFSSGFSEYAEKACLILHGRIQRMCGI